MSVCTQCGNPGDTMNGLCCDCARLQAEGQWERDQTEGETEFGDTVTPDGLEYVFCENHQYRDRIFYDPKEGEYYDRGGDMYLTLEQMGTFAPVFRV